MAIAALASMVPFSVNAWASDSFVRSQKEGSPSPAASYCLNIADKAADARIAWQVKRLNELEAKVKARIAELETRRDEVKVWIDRQNSLLESAEKSLVEVYSKMDADAAASQLAALDMRIAASVLHQLKPREAGAILDVMKTDTAADLVRMIASVSADRPPGSTQ